MAEKPSIIQACNTQPCMTTISGYVIIDDIVTLRFYSDAGELQYSRYFSLIPDGHGSSARTPQYFSAEVKRAGCLMYIDYIMATAPNYLTVNVLGITYFAFDGGHDYEQVTVGPYRIF